MLVVIKNKQQVVFGKKAPAEEIEQAKDILNSNFECKRFPKVKNYQDLCEIIHSNWNHGEIFLHLIESRYSIKEADRLMTDNYLGVYDSIKDLVMDLLNVQDESYRLIDENKCMRELKKKYLIFSQKDGYYIFTK